MKKVEGMKKRVEGGVGKTFVDKSFPRPFQKTLNGKFFCSLHSLARRVTLKNVALFIVTLLFLGQTKDLCAGELSAVPEAFYREGTELSKTDPEQAFRKFSEALKESTPAWNHLSDCFFQRGVLLFDKGDIPNAVQDFSLAIEADQKNFEAFLFMGKCYFMLRKSEECLQALQTAAQMDPKNAEVHYIWARMFMMEIETSGKMLEANVVSAAIEHFTQAIDLNKKYTEAYYYRALAEAATGNSKKALKDLQQAIKINPELYQAWYQIAQVYLTVKLPEEALESLEKCLRIHEFKPAYQLILSICQELKAEDKLKKYLTEALKLYPADPDFKKLREFYKESPQENIPAKTQPISKQQALAKEKSEVQYNVASTEKPEPPVQAPVVKKPLPAKIPMKQNKNTSEFPEENWY